MDPIAVTPIGRVVSSAREPVDAGWGQVVARIELAADFAAGLRGLDAYSHVVVLTWLHEATFEPARDLVRRPRGLAHLPELGSFAQRARHRPNPIGVTTVRIEELGDDFVAVRGLDAIDGTPVLDLKPFCPAFDAPADARVPEWLDELMRGYF